LTFLCTGAAFLNPYYSCGQFQQRYMSSFFERRSQMCQKDFRLFGAFGICAGKNCSNNVDEIDAWC
jgi:hypothetical protein